jgi:hypothetical protein
MCSGAGSKFPAKYQQAIFACDWSYGVLYAIHLTPNGAGYSAQAEKFITGRPLPLTQVAIGPDGNLYFIVGGRKTQSGLYRVSYAGGEPTAPATMKLDGEAAKLHALRKSLESFYGKPADAAAVDAALPLLGHPDRLIRFTARNVLEQQPVATWQDKALAIKDPEALIYAVIGLARQADKSIEPRLIEALNSISIDSLTSEQQVDLLRAYEMVFTRMGTPGSLGKTVVEKLEPRFPAGSWPLNRELAALLVYVDAPNAVSKIALRPSAPCSKRGVPLQLSLETTGTLP